MGRLNGLLQCGGDKNRLEALELHQNFVLPGEQKKRTEIAIKFFSENMNNEIRFAALNVLSFLARSNLLNKKQLTSIFKTFNRLSKKGLVDSSYVETLFEFLQYPCNENIRLSAARLMARLSESNFNENAVRQLADSVIFETNSEVALECRRLMEKISDRDEITRMLSEANTKERKLEFISYSQRATGPESEQYFQRVLDFLAEGDEDIGFECRMLFANMAEESLIGEIHIDRLLAFLTSKNSETAKISACMLEDAIDNDVKLTENQVLTLQFSILKMLDIQLGMKILYALEKSGQITRNDIDKIMSSAVDGQRREYVRRENDRWEMVARYRETVRRVPQHLLDELDFFQRRKKKQGDRERLYSGSRKRPQGTRGAVSRLEPSVRKRR